MSEPGGREYSLSSAARLIGVDKHTLARWCDAEPPRVTHTARPTERGGIRRLIPHSEVVRLRGVIRFRAPDAPKKPITYTRKAHFAPENAPISPDASLC